MNTLYLYFAFRLQSIQSSEYACHFLFKNNFNTVFPFLLYVYP
jgi:hypothetical protein